MNIKRAEKYINIWLKYIKQKNLEMVKDNKELPLELLEKEIGMSLENFVSEIFVNLYNRYSSSISYIPVKFDDYGDYIIAPKNGSYSLEDFLLNRLLRCITSISYVDSIFDESYYQYEYGIISIDKNRMENQLKDIHQKRKLVAHEMLHGLKTKFYKGEIFDADNYFEMKEELKSIFGNEINNFKRPSNQQNCAKSYGIEYSTLWKKNNSKKYSELDLNNLDEILNELEAIDVSNDNFRVFGYITNDRCYGIALSNPESSNAWITNYSFILEKLVDEETLFTGLYIEPEIFYNYFNQYYSKIFQKHYGSNLSAIEILTKQLELIKKAHIDNTYIDISLHSKLLNTLYECMEQKYVLSGFNDELRQKNILRIGSRGVLQIVNGVLCPYDALDYCDEYSILHAKSKK